MAERERWIRWDDGHFKTWDEVKVEPFTGTKLPEEAQLYLMVGPTGAGKSSFIESFAGETQKLSISKDQLEGYTQTVAIYKLLHVFRQDYLDYREHGKPIYLIDTPGFSDSQISELEVMEMIQKCLASVGVHSICHIFFFIPINTPRLAGSRRRTIDMFKTLLGAGTNLGAMTFITTMWDALHNDRVRGRAESNFVQLRDEVLAECIAGGANITRFTNTKQSPDNILRHPDSISFDFYTHITGGHPHGPILYQDLIDRIKSCLQEQKNIEDDLETHDVEASLELQEIQERKYDENQELLWKFFGQYLNLRDPPAELARAIFDLDKTIIETTGYLEPHSPYKNLLYDYRYEDPDSIDRNWLTLHRHLQYAFNCEDVKSALQDKEMTVLDLAVLDDATNSEARFVLEQQQIENKRVLIRAIARWFRFGEPPKEVDAITHNLRKSIMSYSDLIPVDSAWEDVFYLWTHNPRWYPRFYGEPNDIGVFWDSIRDHMKEQREDHESSNGSRNTS